MPTVSFTDVLEAEAKLHKNEKIIFTNWSSFFIIFHGNEELRLSSLSSGADGFLRKIFRI